MTTLTREHFRTSSPAGVWHQWTVSDGQRKIAMNALRTMHLGMPGVPDPATHLIASTGGAGIWVLDAILAETADSSDLIGADVAGGAWQAIASVGVADDVVFVTLETIHRQVFGGAA